MIIVLEAFAPKAKPETQHANISRDNPTDSKDQNQKHKTTIFLEAIPKKQEFQGLQQASLSDNTKTKNAKTSLFLEAVGQAIIWALGFVLRWDRIKTLTLKPLVCLSLLGCFETNLLNISRNISLEV